MTHELKIPNSSTLLLISVLSQPGWAKTIEDIIIGGSLLVEVFGKFEPKKIPKAKVNKDDPDETEFDKVWLDEIHVAELTEKQRECCKRAITSTINDKKMPVAKTSFFLVKAFGLE